MVTLRVAPATGYRAKRKSVDKAKAKADKANKRIKQLERRLEEAVATVESAAKQTQKVAKRLAKQAKLVAELPGKVAHEVLPSSDTAEESLRTSVDRQTATSPARESTSKTATKTAATPSRRASAKKSTAKQTSAMPPEDGQEVGFGVGDPSAGWGDSSFDEVAIGRPGVEDPSGAAGARALA